MTRERAFPIQSDQGGDDSTLVYKVLQSTFDGAYVVVGDTVFLSDEGIEILHGDGTYASQNAYSIVDDDHNDLGGLYGHHDTTKPSTALTLQVNDEEGEGSDLTLYLRSFADPTADSGVNSLVSIQADRVGEATNTFVRVFKDDVSSYVQLYAAGQIQIKPKIGLVGASGESCSVYMKGSYYIIKYDDSGTIRYKYLDLSGTGVTWVHSTSEP